MHSTDRWKCLDINRRNTIHLLESRVYISPTNIVMKIGPVYFFGLYGLCGGWMISYSSNMMHTNLHTRDIVVAWISGKHSRSIMLYDMLQYHFFLRPV